MFGKIIREGIRANFNDGTTNITGDATVRVMPALGLPETDIVVVPAVTIIDICENRGEKILQVTTRIDDTRVTILK